MIRTTTWGGGPVLALLAVLAGPAQAVTIYVTASNPLTGTHRLYSLDPVTAAPTLIGDMGLGIRAIDFHPLTGELWGSGFDSTGFTPILATIDLITGQAVQQTTLARNVIFFANPRDIEFLPDGRLFATQSRGDLYEIDPITGVLTQRSTFAGGGGLITRSGELLVYQGNRKTDPHSGALWAVNLATGGRTRFLDLTTNAGAHRMDTVGDTAFALFTCVVCGGELVRYDLGSDPALSETVGTPSFPMGFGPDGIAVLPEPAALPMLALGAMALAFARTGGQRRTRSIVP